MMNRLDFVIKKREMELKLQLAEIKKLKRNQRMIRAIDQKIYHVKPMEIFVAWVGSFMDWVTDLVKKNDIEE